jgi:hypothetical protein
MAKQHGGARNGGQHRQKKITLRNNRIVGNGVSVSISGINGMGNRCHYRQARSRRTAAK